MSENTQDLRAALYAPFALEDHEIREGGKNFAKTKIQWFVYIGREAIQARLDELCFMRWTLDFHTPIKTEKFYAITARLAIDGVWREYGGGQRVKGTDNEMTEDVIKGAHTDGFRRAASMWGIGLYLQKTPQIWTATYDAKDWDAKRAREKEAWEVFAAWFSRKPAPQAPHNAPKQAQGATGETGGVTSQAKPLTAQGKAIKWAEDNNYDTTQVPKPNDQPHNEMIWKQWCEDVLVKNRVVS